MINTGDQMAYMIDTHIHTRSSDSSASYRSIVRSALERKLDAIAVTDHSTLTGVKKVKRAAREYDIDIIPGLEINAGVFHIIALDVYDVIPDKLSISKTVEKIDRQDGLAIIAHPTNGRQKYMSIIEDLIESQFVGIECMVVHGGSYQITKNIDAFIFAEKYGLPKIGCSDAHCSKTVGLAVSLCAGRSFKDFRRAFKSNKLWVGRNKFIEKF